MLLQQALKTFTFKVQRDLFSIYSEMSRRKRGRGHEARDLVKRGECCHPGPLQAANTKPNRFINCRENILFPRVAMLSSKCLMGRFSDSKMRQRQILRQVKQAKILCSKFLCQVYHQNLWSEPQIYITQLGMIIFRIVMRQCFQFYKFVYFIFNF